jgi:ATP-dependent protease Clp ATPase subunit
MVSSAEKNLHICNECLSLCRDVVAEDKGPPRQLPKGLVCNFCDRGHPEVQKLVAGPTVYICDACVASASNVLA